jgi:hypothetical protein
MAPRKLSVTEMLAKKGYDVDEEEVGTEIDVDGKEYRVANNENGDKIFVEILSKELEAETYDEEEKVVDKSDEETEDSVEAKKEEKKPHAKNGAEKEKKIRKPRAKKNVEEKVDEVVSEKVEIEESDSSETTETIVVVEKDEAVKKEKKPRKPRTKKEKTDVSGESSSSDDGGKKKRKRRDPSKPKRHREKTCHNVYISEKIFELQQSHPDMSGRERFAYANKLWKELDVDAKGKLMEEFKAAKALAKSEAELVAVEA